MTANEWVLSLTQPMDIDLAGDDNKEASEPMVVVDGCGADVEMGGLWAFFAF